VGAFYGIYRTFPGDFSGVCRRRDFQALLGACVMVRAETFKAVGGFENFVLEDIDLCLKIRALGLRVIYEPRAVVLHHGSVTLNNSAPGSFAPADTAAFSARWSQSKLVCDDEVFYAEDGFKLLGMRGDIPELKEVVGESTQLRESAQQRRLAGDRAGEEEFLRAAVNTWHGDTSAWYELLALYIETGRTNQALDTGLRMVKHVGTSGVRLIVADLFRQCGRFVEVNEIVEEIVADRSSSSEDRERAQGVLARCL